MEVYLLSDPKKFLDTLETLDSIQKALEILYHKTGLRIDEYGTTRLYLDHVKLLDGHTDTNSPWKKIFQDAIQQESGILIIGD